MYDMTEANAAITKLRGVRASVKEYVARTTAEIDRLNAGQNASITAFVAELRKEVDETAAAIEANPIAGTGTGGPPWPVYQSNDPNAENYLAADDSRWQSSDPNGQYYCP